MSHGAGGKATQSLIEGLFVPAFDSQPLAELGDAGAVDVDGAQLAMTTDTFVVKPIRSPAGTIGELAVNGTVNDLAAAGARPLALSVSLVLEEGLSADDLRAQVEAIAGAARAADVADRGRRHQGRGARPRRRDVREHHRASACATRARSCPPARCSPATACWSPARSASTARRSCWPATSSRSRPRSSPTPARCGPRPTRCWVPPAPTLRCMRDATRGGVATVLNELARASQVAMVAKEAAVPVRPRWRARPSCSASTRCTWPTRAGMVAFVAPEAAEEALAALRAVPGCEEAAEIGEVRTEPPGMVLVETAFGGKRVMDLLAGDPLPRIC